jgi:hypothetical protein
VVGNPKCVSPQNSSCRKVVPDRQKPNKKIGGGTLTFSRASACATNCIFASSELVAPAAEYCNRVLKLAMERCGSILLEMRRQASRDNRSRCFICCFGWLGCSIPSANFTRRGCTENQRWLRLGAVLNCNHLSSRITLRSRDPRRRFSSSTFPRGSARNPHVRFSTRLQQPLQVASDFEQQLGPLNRQPDRQNR